MMHPAPIHPDGVDLIKEFEGLSLTAYRDPVGVWTIGYGHTGPEVVRGLVISQDQADAWLADDISEAAALVDLAVTAPLNAYQRAALVSIVFNVGAGRRARPGRPGRAGIITLANGQPSTLLRRLNAGDYAGAAAAFEQWVYAGGQKLAGLVRRRKAERALFERAGHAA
jgi:lysozyme